MERIAIRFPEVKFEMPIEGIKFDELEELAFDISRQIGCKAIEGFLGDLDDGLRKERPKGELENRGKVFKHILTRLGDVKYSRVRYKEKSTGRSRYLVDEAMGLELDQRISLSRQKLEVHAVSEVTYRQGRENIKRITGSSRSYEAMRQSVIKEAEKIIEHQERSLKKMRLLEYDADIEAPETAYSEADGTVIRLQRRRKGKELTVRNRKKRHVEVKLGIGYTGREARYNGGEGRGKRLVKKFVHVSMKSRARFMEEFSLIAERRLNLSGAQKILFGGDGDEWIKSGMRTFFSGAKYLLCRYHLQKAITTGLAGMKTRIKEVRYLISKDNIDGALEKIADAARNTNDMEKREAIEGLHTYIRNNREGILAANELGEDDKTGAIEPNIDKVVAQRMKNRGMSWSRKGAISLLKIKETIINGDWDNWWSEDRDEKITINSEWKKPLPATCFKKPGEQVPWLETTIPALDGVDQDKPWARVLREITRSRYEMV
jgi:hypothetical protein